MEKNIKNMSIYDIAIMCRQLEQIAVAGNVHAEYLGMQMRFALYTKIEIENLQNNVISLISILKANQNK